jgi:hypothetical protein
MKAILRWGAALLSLLLLSSISHGYYWVSGALRTPLPHAPDTRGPGYYSQNAYGQWSGPHYYLVPPNRPFGGMLPGPTGQAIMWGNLPHTLLMGKQGMSMGNAPMLGAPPPQAAPPPQQGAMGRAPMLGSPAMQQYGMMQMPHAAMATGQYGTPMPYTQGMQAPMGYGPKPMMWAPYPGQAQPPMQMQPQGPQAMYWKASNGIWQVQNASGPHGPMPFSTIPGYQPGVPPTGTQMQPMHPMGPMHQFGPMQPPQMNMQQLELPRMDPMPMPMPMVGGSAYPVHPFTRSPRDFFMWGEVMEQERARANRPFPVP